MKDELTTERRELFQRLASDPFRSRFSLKGRELAHLQTWGLERTLEDARKLLSRRLASPFPINDGRQTPWRGHPVFVAQHATATCCRGCVKKWHGIERGRALDRGEIEDLLFVIRWWLSGQLGP